MPHSKVSKKWQTTIPAEVRKALGIKPGQQLIFEFQGDKVTMRVHPGAASFRGALRSDKGRGLSFAQIREEAARLSLLHDPRWAKFPPKSK
ncbi:MAG: AbrB/MazE/SpoVT family DNA-binding domain-containing protein [Planctomycetota bacterium]|nr:AbrB/MazE/SpoVT family DNA-binding domain-containing protein [Planctomycetota bacterium]